MARTFFRNARLIDGRSPVKNGVTVVVDGERISAVVKDQDAPQPSPADAVFDLVGRSLMPGMIQTHFHAAYENGRGIFLRASPTMLTLIAARHAESLLRSGYTGAIGAGTPHYIDVTLRDAINTGLIPGPRFMASGPGLLTSGDPVSYHPSWWEPNIDEFEHTCDGPEGFRKAVRDEARRGVDIVKTSPTGGHGLLAPSDTMTMTAEEMKAAADAAHGHGKKIRGHIVPKRAIVAALDAEYDVIDHADMMDESCIERFVKQGTFIVPSLYYTHRKVEDAKRRGKSDTVEILEMKRGLENMRRMLPVAQAAGVKLVVGDDFGVPGMPHGDYAAELETYAEFGIAALDVIEWATSRGAELLGMKDDLGTIEAGKLADLLVVNGDPSLDLAVLKDRSNLDVIMKGGAFLECRLEPATERIPVVIGAA